MIIVYRKNILQVAVIAFCAGFILLGYKIWMDYSASSAVFHAQSYSTATVIIDPGHGGEDGGAVSASGQAESAINLSIGQKTDAIMGLFGINTVMTRSEDISLHSEDAKTLHQKKVSDLKNRVALINGIENGVLISIHQNTFPDAGLYGAQVFYSDEQSSLAFAKLAQSILRSVLNENNRRQAARIASSVYLMKKVECPAILIECGFLSNPDETRLLVNDSYQTKIAVGICASFLGYQETQG